jgi:hypothetical protein
MSGPPIPPSLPEEEYYYLPPRKTKPVSPLPPLWSIALTVVLVLSTAGCLIAALIALGGTVPRSTEPVVVVVSAAAPTLPPISERLQGSSPPLAVDGATPAAEPVTLAGPTLIPTATITPTPIAITVGATVVVISPGGVNIRSVPGTESARNFVADVNDTFVIIDGPQLVDGLLWWQIRDTFNSSRTGWVAENDGLSDLIEVFVP